MLTHWFRPKPRPQAAGPALASARLIELRRVVKVYTTPAGGFTALHGVELTVDRGEFVAIVGKSGSGKSTLINMITGIDRPTSGEVIVGGAPIHTFGEERLSAWRGRTLGIIFQFFQLLPSLTVAENVMLPMDFCGVGGPWERPARAMSILERVGMAEHAHKLPAALSGGQQQRVAIARALANDPPVLVADEPTGNLDSRTAAAVFALFEELAAAGTTILMVTHDRDLARRADRAVLVADGRITEEETPHAEPALAQSVA